MTTQLELPLPDHNRPPLSERWEVGSYYSFSRRKTMFYLYRVVAFTHLKDARQHRRTWHSREAAERVRKQLERSR